jgi:hypothetical protein
MVRGLAVAAPVLSFLCAVEGTFHLQRIKSVPWYDVKSKNNAKRFVGATRFGFLFMRRAIGKSPQVRCGAGHALGTVRTDRGERKFALEYATSKNPRR